MEHEIKRERVTDSIAKRREAGKDLGGRPRRITGGPAGGARGLGKSRATFYRRSRALEG